MKKVFNATSMCYVYNTYKEGKNLLKYKYEKSLYVSIKMPVRNLCLVMPHDAVCPRSDVWQAYRQVLQCLKPRPVLALHRVHSREVSHTQIRCTERTECFNRLLCDDKSTHVGQTTRMRPYLLMSASVSLFCHSLFPSAHIFLQQLILLSLTLLTQTDLAPSPRKIHQVVGNILCAFTQQWQILHN
jgi:hypothetical protein